MLIEFEMVCIICCYMRYVFRIALIMMSLIVVEVKLLFIHRMLGIFK